MVVVGLAGTGTGHPGAAAAPSAAALWGRWMLMLLTMLPLVAPQARRLALRGLWRRRHRAVVGFVAGHLGLGAAAGTAVVGVLAVLGPPTPAAPVAVLVAGAAWQVAPVRRRLLNRCGVTRPAPVRGWAADRACVAAGWRAGGRCLVLCGPAMLAMALAHGLLLMAALLALLLHERSRGPNPGRRAGGAMQACGFLACAALAAVLAG
jgi:hypothetical protein